MSRFLRRHPSIQSKLGVQLDRSRHIAKDRTVIRDYFQKFQRIIQKYNIRPSDVYNFDEKGVLIGKSARRKVVVRRGQKVPYFAGDGSREWVTVVETVRAAPSIADGCIVPPVFISKGQQYSEKNFRYVFWKSEKGYITAELALRYITKHFDLHTRAHADNGKRHRLLILDGHISHTTIEFIEFCMENNIHVLCLPSHSTHLLQPLDVAMFSPLQFAYGSEVDQWCRNPRNESMSLASFFLLYHKARLRALTTKNARSSFECTGHFPFKPQRVLDKIDMKDNADWEQDPAGFAPGERKPFDHTKPIDPAVPPQTPH
ncbi:DDE-domain-containing protein, partial [Ascobolus immersus RN42]